ncbi:MAG: ATP-dependent Clp protease ATP-binding subunit [Oscillospiraceae bacterium]
MKKQELSGRLRGLIVQAGRFARELGHSYVGTEHLLLALSQEAGSAGRVLRAAGLEEPCLRSMVLAGAGLGSRTLFLPQGLTPRARRAVHQAGVEASRLKTGGVTPEHLLLALTRDDGCTACRILKGSGIAPDCIFTETFGALRTPEQTQQGRQTSVRLLEQYCENMIEKAARMEPVVGRERELCEVEQILCRKNKNNPALIGEPGVGKTAIVEALAQRLASGQAPQGLVGKKLYRLDLASVLAGTKYRGEFEERIRDILAEIRRAGNMILFVDEMHTIVGAGSAEGAIDAANLLKPALGRGEIQLIGATTLEEYRKYIEKDAALERRFRQVLVREPTKEQTLRILQGLRPGLEQHHRIRISDEAMQAAVELSCRYLADRFLPDKAIDLLDEAAASIWLSGGTVDARLEEKKRRLSQELEQAVRDGAYEHAAALRDRLQELVRRQAESSRAQRMLLVTREDVAGIVSQRTGIPAGALSRTEKERLLQLEQALHERVVGQDAAVEAVCRAVRRGRSGMADEERPAASMLFAGPTGVGKTELCKALADVVYGSADSLVRIDMSEYMEPGSVTRLIGAPPGYVGHEEAGTLTEKVRRRPYCVVLLDEVEKAHRDVRNLLLQVMDDGMLTDAMGRTVSFKNAIVVMTSNAGSGEDRKGGLGFLPQEASERFALALRQLFSPEFLGRIDCVACFTRLGLPELTEIARRQLEKLCARANVHGLRLSIAPGAAEELARQALSSSGGAREIRHLLQTCVQTPLADALLSDTLTGNRVVAAREGKLVVTVTGDDRTETGK